MVPKTTRIDAIAIRQWIGADPKISPLGIEFECTEGTLFDLLYRYFDFESIVEHSLKTRNQPGDADHENELERIESLKKQLAGGKVKINIKLEVENYVR